MEIVSKCIQRRPSRTVSRVLVDGFKLCYAIEDVIRDRDTDGDGDVDAVDVAKFKVYGQTAIPAGRYRVTLEESPKYGPDTITINNVPGFEYIRAHTGNDETHTEGCQILGMALTPNGTILYGTTKPAVAAMKSRIKAAIDRGEEVWWSFDRSITMEV